MRRGKSLGLALAFVSVEVLAGPPAVTQEARAEYLDLLHQYDKFSEENDLKKTLNSTDYKKFPFYFETPVDEKVEIKAAREIMARPLSADEIECRNQLLSNKDKLPSIRLMADSHFCPNCQLERLSSALDAREEKCIFGSEPSVCEKVEENQEELSDAGSGGFPALLAELPNSKVKSLGIEGPSRTTSDVTDQIAASFDPDHKNEKIVPVANRDNDKRSSEASENRFDDALQLIMGLTVSPKYEKFRNEIEEVAKTNEKFKSDFADPIMQIRKILLSGAEGDEKDFLPLLHKVANPFLAKFTYQQLGGYLIKMMKVHFKALLAEKTRDIEGSPAVKKLLEKKNFSFKDWIIINRLYEGPLRDKEFARNILFHYCKYALPKGLPLVINLGFLHSYPTKFVIEKSLASAGFPVPKVSIDPMALTFLNMPLEKREEHVKVKLDEIDARLKAAH
jgi:hypothetical protein